MRRSIQIIVGLVVLLSLLALTEFTASETQGRIRDQDIEAINTLLDNLNKAASDADFDGYFACLAPDGIFIGTDATERWTMDELKAFVKPYYEQGQSRDHTPLERHVDLCSGGGSVAYFDELIELEGLGVTRGTGVVIKTDDERWLITQYSMCFPIPNELAFEVTGLIQDFLAPGNAPDEVPVDSDTSVRSALDAYLATAAWPDPKPIDPELYAEEIEAFWSNGLTYRGREAVVREVKVAQDEFAADFEVFKAHAESVRIHRRDDVAWVTCLIRLSGTLTNDRGEFMRSVRSSFVFEQADGRWQMVHEHSERVDG